MTIDRDAAFRTAILAVGIAVAGWFAGNGAAHSRSGDRFVAVKGISEREVQADLAIWPLRVVTANNDLAAAHAQLEGNVVKIRQFLASQQIDTTQSELQDFSVTDAYANQFGSGDRASTRYVIHETVLVRSIRPATVLKASQHVAELVTAGVVLSSGGEYGSGGPTFIFTGLNRIKPEMIAEATARAHQAAEQFAHDSRSSLGGIRQANQGVFEILPRDQAQGISEAGQITKTVRVVSSVDYFLRN